MLKTEHYHHHNTLNNRTSKTLNRNYSNSAHTGTFFRTFYSSVVSFFLLSSHLLFSSSSPFLHLHMFSSAVLCFSKSLLRMQNFPFIFKILYPSFTTNLFSFTIDLHAASAAGETLSSSTRWRLVKTTESGNRHT